MMGMYHHCEHMITKSDSDTSLLCGMFNYLKTQGILIIISNIIGDINIISGDTSFFIMKFLWETMILIL